MSSQALVDNPDLVNDFKCRLTFFEGPLDLLLYLIKKNEIDIYSVKLEEITNQYIEYLNLMQLLNIEIAADFLVTAASLLHLKSKALLPDDGSTEEEEGKAEDLGNDLLQKLLEYKQYKEAASHLEGLQDMNDNTFPRGANVLEEKGPPKVVTDAGVFDIFTALQEVLKKVKLKSPREVFAEQFTVEAKLEQMRRLLQEKQTLRFAEFLAESSSKEEVICFFLSILELVRLQEASVEQDGKIFGEILIKRKTHGYDKSN